jgi:NADPH-dependent 2,4-dienoyl-CoA reductase/sulfur reductase-like enzyme/nitrite reductase/ring-hydroxylating ferredoxin subunit
VDLLDDEDLGQAVRERLARQKHLRHPARAQPPDELIFSERFHLILYRAARHHLARGTSPRFARLADRNVLTKRSIEREEGAMGDAPKVSGPDLSAGVGLDELHEGKPLVGHVGDDGVMLIKRNGEIFATGNTCTHYSGPLGEGLVVGDTVRCPWHHACFDLRTGEAARAPALNPIPCYAVVRDGDRVRVGERRAPAVPAASKPGEPKKIVIVGAGAAGQACAEQLRTRGYRGQLVLIGADPAGPVDRPNLSKDYLAGTAPEEWIPLRPREWFAAAGVDRVRGRRVTSIDPKAKTVTLDDGRSYDWERLLLATGAEPVVLPIPGAAELGHVHYLRTLADARDIIADAQAGRRAVVVGASFIGLEVAASLRTRGVEVDVVAPDEVPLQRVMGRELGAYIRTVHESHGVRFHLGRKPKVIEAAGADKGSLSVRLDDDTHLGCDFVVIGVGVRPATKLAADAGLTVDNGIVVDERLQTSVEGIFAAGDLARWPDRHSGAKIRVEHWVVAQRQGQTAARNMLGASERFDAVPFFWSMHYDVGINYVGHAERWDRIELDGRPEDKDCAMRFIIDDRVAALATIFRDTESLEAEHRMEQG